MQYHKINAEEDGNDNEEEDENEDDGGGGVDDFIDGGGVGEMRYGDVIDVACSDDRRRFSMPIPTTTSFNAPKATR